MHGELDGTQFIAKSILNHSIGGSLDNTTALVTVIGDVGKPLRLMNIQSCRLDRLCLTRGL
jgi:hypothetical protein